MKKTPLSRGTKQMKRSGFKRATKRATSPKVKIKPKKRVLLPTLGKLQKQADSFLTPVCKKTHPNCEACGKLTEVGHHWIEKSRSSYLRYDMRNIIALCHSCHAKIHNRFGNSVVGGFDVASKIISKRGINWKEQLDRDQPKYVKVDRFFYTENIARLQGILEGG